MGEVYRARDTRLGRDVAIKVLPASLSGDADRLRRFEQEARAAGVLNHPNILTIYDIATHEGSPCVVSELLEGQTLRERLGSGSLPVRKATEYALEIARGLAAAHDKGIVNRDLKPENVFLTSDARVKILDFGLAKLTQAEKQEADAATISATEPGAVLGTVGYMSPEQVRGRAADHRADIFSFGAILYEMVAGRRAFRGESPVETMNAILKEDPPELSVAPALERIVRRCLEKNPQERFQSARDLAFALEAMSWAPTATTTQLPAPEAARRRRWLLVALTALAAVGLLAILAGKRMGTPSAPSFHRLTFRRGGVWAARFAPDGQTILYSAFWEGNPLEIFSTRPESPESRPLGFPGAGLLAVSRSGELAISLNSRVAGRGGPFMAGTLARMPLTGGAPREILEDVEQADWAPDGKSLAIVRFAGQRTRLEFPIGKSLYETTGNIAQVRVSPKGDLVAIVESMPVPGGTLGSSVAVVNLAGQRTTLSSGWVTIWGLAWTPRGDEIWFTAVEAGDAGNLMAVTPKGKHRLLARTAGGLVLHDISAGRALLDRYNLQIGMAGLVAGETQERELSWLDWSAPADLSADGKLLLFTESGKAVAMNPAVYLRKTDGSPAVRLGDGQAKALSPDARWALATLGTSPPQLVLLPTGAGTPRPLPRGAIARYGWVSWFPDGRRILFLGAEPDHAARWYAQDVEGGHPQAVTPEGMQLVPLPHALSPDGKLFAAIDPQAKLSLYSVQGGAPRQIPGVSPGEVPIRWSKDARSLYVLRPGGLPARVYRLDISTGRRELWKEILPADRAGMREVWPVLMTPDAKSYVYGYSRYLTDLYLVDGLK